MSNGGHLKRPDTHLIKAVYDRLYHSSTTLSRIKDNVLGGRFLNQPQNQSQNVIAVPGRSLVWKTFLLSTEPLKPEEFSPLGSIRSARHAYREAMLDKMCAPDGSYEEHFVIPGSYEAPTRVSHRHPSSRDLVTNNPLSLDIQNPWTDWFTALELRKTILQDVERTFPDIDYFRHPSVQYQLTNILYLYSITHAHIGYRQGMHELLAPIYYAVDHDSVSTAPKEDGDDGDGDSRTYLNWEEVDDYSDGARAFLEMCDRAWVSADAYALFDAVMAGAGRWYEWRENPAASTFTGAGGGGGAGGSISSASSAASTPTSSAFASHVNMNVAEGQVNPANYVAPIVQTCGQIQSAHLKSVDPALAQALQRAGIEPQIYGIRWLRLLFTREFPLADAMLLWDGLFACDTSLDLVPWICVAMLVRIRNQLIHGDYSAKLTCLLHYPPLPGTSHEGEGDNENENEEKDKDDGLLPHHITLLLRQALAFQMAPTSSTGSSIVSENRNMLGIPLEVAAPASAGATSVAGSGRQSPHPHHYQHHHQQRPDPARRSHPGSAAAATTEGRALMLESGGSASHVRNQSTASIPEMLARGLLDRGESLGINKTVMSAYSEFKKNFPDLASSLVRSPTPSDALSSFPLSVERPIEERPPWEPRPRLEIESELAELRKRDRLLGQSVSRIVDVLLLQDSVGAGAADTGNDRDDGESTRRQKELQERKREALENLAYVRDLLMGGQVGETDEERLFGEEEARRRKRERQKQQQQSTSTSSESKSTTSRPTVEAPLIPKPSASAASTPHSLSFPRKMTSHPLSPGPAAGVNAPRHPSSSRSGMTPTEQSPWQQTDRHRPPLSTSSSSSKLRDMAPWNRTPSNFGVDNQSSTVVPMALPQLPPRTSSTHHTTSSTHRPSATVVTRTGSSAAGNNSAKKKTDQPPPVQQDPLGVL